MEKEKEAIDWLSQAIEVTLRRGDVYTRYSQSQCLILLSGTSSDDCETIFQRIRSKFQELNPNPFCQIDYEIVEIIELGKE